MSHPSQFAVYSLFTVFVLGGCRVTAPQKASDAINLMTTFNQRGRHDDAIKVAQDWLKKHPEDPFHGATLYEQLALTYLAKASQDRAHKDEWIQQAVAYYDKDLSVHQKGDIDVELYTVGRGLELAGDLSTGSSCSLYDRAVRDFEDEVLFIQGDSYIIDSKTIPLAPVRKENERALERVKGKFSKVGCK